MTTKISAHERVGEKGGQMWKGESPEIGDFSAEQRLRRERQPETPAQIAFLPW
jgi:hypothetical protein